MGEIKNSYEWSYKGVLRHVLSGEVVSNRNQDTFVQFACQITADLSEGFPMLTGRKMFLKNTVHELKWMLNGDTNTKYLQDNGVSIWNQWADNDGNLGPIYGYQMRNFSGIDQITWLLEEMKTPIRSRRGLVSMWNPADLKDMRLPPCHYAFNLVDINGTLNLSVSMRSLDLFIGLPYDMSFYALLLELFCHELGKQPGKVTINAADCHIYTDHKDACREFLNRPHTNLPDIHLGINPTVLGFNPDDIELSNYTPGAHIKASVHA